MTNLVIAKAGFILHSYLIQFCKVTEIHFSPTTFAKRTSSLRVMNKCLLEDLCNNSLTLLKIRKNNAEHFNQLRFIYITFSI